MAGTRSTKKKSLSKITISRYAPPDAHVPMHLGGGILKELVEQEIPSGKLHRYSLAYINPSIFSGDNGRVLGYDNAHGYPHRHYLGKVTMEQQSTWTEIRQKFDEEWQAIAFLYMKERKK